MPPLVPLNGYLSCGDDLRLLHTHLNKLLDDFGDRKCVSRDGDKFTLSAPTNAVYEAAWELMLWNTVARNPAAEDHRAPLAGVEVWGAVDDCIQRDFPDAYTVRVRDADVPLLNVVSWWELPEGAKDVAAVENTMDDDPALTARDAEVIRDVLAVARRWLASAKDIIAQHGRQGYLPHLTGALERAAVFDEAITRCEVAVGANGPAVISARA